MNENYPVFQPKRPAKFASSSLYALSMYAKTFALCARYLARAFVRQTDIKTTDGYLKEFWQIQLEETFTTVYVKGRHHLKPGITYVFMSNHESWLDIPAMFAAVPTSLRMVAKAGIMNIPVVGPAMEKAGFIAIDRANRSRAIRQLDLARQRLREGISIWMAPEGTRSRDGEIAPFKKGGFHVAVSLGLDIVPVYIEGARDVMPADGLTVYTNRSITVHFCEPISTDGIQKFNINQLVERVREAILAKREQMREINDDESAL